MRRFWAGLLSVAIAFSGMAAAQAPVMPEAGHDRIMPMDCVSMTTPLPVDESDCDDKALCAVHCLSVHPFVLTRGELAVTPSILAIAAVTIDVRTESFGQAPPLPPPRA